MLVKYSQTAERQSTVLSYSSALKDSYERTVSAENQVHKERSPALQKSAGHDDKTL